MMNLNQVREALQDRNLTRVAEAVGLSYETVRRVASGKERNFSYSVIKALSDYLSQPVEQ